VNKYSLIPELVLCGASSRVSASVAESGIREMNFWRYSRPA